VIRQSRDRWVERGLLRRSDDYDEFDLLELVVLKLLFDTLRKSHVELAWSRVRPSLREVIPGSHLTLVWDIQHRSAELSLDDATLSRLVRHGRLVQALDIGKAIDEARRAFRREIERVTIVAEAPSTRRLARERKGEGREPV
jgi:hypothetical protein